MTCLGVDVDSVERMVSIPDAKLCQIDLSIKEWLQKHFLFQEAVAVPSRQPSLCPQMCETWQNVGASQKQFDKFLDKYNGRAFFDHKPVCGVLELDACLTGLGGR